MKNKTKTYVLVIAVLGIWGLVGYRIIASTNKGSNKSIAKNEDTLFKPKPIEKSEVFLIQNVDRDPFLGALESKKKAKKKVQKKKKDLTKEPLPIVSYQGLVKTQNSAQPIFIVTLNNKQHLLKKGQKINDITIANGNSNEINIQFKGERITIKKQ